VGAAEPDDERDAGPDMPVHFNLEQAEMIDLMHAFTMLVDKPVVVDPGAQPQVACASITAMRTVSPGWLHAESPLAP
jgi:hypothetical protein